MGITRAERPDFFYGFGRQLTFTVRVLLALQVLAFFLQLLLADIPGFTESMGLVPARVTRHLAFWQPVTSLFLHAGLLSLLMDSLVLWFFAPDVEFALGGGKRFVVFYLLCGALSNAVAVLFQPFSLSLAMGPSGAIFGVLTAFAVLFPQRIITLLLFFVIPVQLQAKYLVLIFGAIEWLVFVQGRFSQISSYATLAGIPLGYFLAKRPSLLAWEWLKRHPGAAGRREKEDYIRRNIDPILEKIAKQGMHSLSWREKRVLKKAKGKLNQR